MGVNWAGRGGLESYAEVSEGGKPGLRAPLIIGRNLLEAILAP